MDEVGGSAQQDNPVMQAHYEVSRKIRGAASDERSRDIGIVASGQLALHYWIASFGTLRTYAQNLGMDRIAQDLQSSLDEAKQADEQHNQIAAQLFGDGQGQQVEAGQLLDA